MWMLIMKISYTEVKSYPEVKSQTSLRSFQVSCKNALKSPSPFQKEKKNTHIHTYFLGKFQKLNNCPVTGWAFILKKTKPYIILYYILTYITKYTILQKTETRKHEAARSLDISSGMVQHKLNNILSYLLFIRWESFWEISMALKVINKI